MNPDMGSRQVSGKEPGRETSPRVFLPSRDTLGQAFYFVME